MTISRQLPEVGAARSRIGVLGGTFDPPHLGHLAAASVAAGELGLDAVVFVPTGDPWQKRAAAVTAGGHRLAMTTLATAGDHRFRVSRVDLDRAGPTYTVDTLRDLRAEHPGAELFFLAGADTLAGLPGWYRAEEVVAQAQVVGMTRPGSALTAPAALVGRVVLLTVPGLDISSSDCRERVGRGASIRYLVPDAVVAYIGDHRLYVGDDVAGA